MPSCGSCGEGRFSNGAQLQCHRSMNHATFPCGCGRNYMTDVSRAQHVAARQANAKPVDCNDCCKSFNNSSALHQHKVDKNHSPPAVDQNKDCHCGRKFKSTEGKEEHIKGKHNLLNFKPCLMCNKEFKTSEKLKQHKRDSDHHYKASDDLAKRTHVYLANRHSKSTVVSKDDNKRSVKSLHDRVDRIMDHVRKQENGQIYGNELRNAGSYSTKTKIGKADEFDLNVPLNLKEEDVEISAKGKIDYKYDQPSQGGAKSTNLNVERSIRNTKHEISKGYAAVKLKENVDKEPFEKIELNRYIDPRKVKEDLYGKMKSAIKELDLKDVTISRDAHGPAVTLTIKDPEVGHDISVDVSATIDKSPVPLSEHCWPRPSTKETIPLEKIDKVLTSGTHLVPKGDEFWYVSSSKAEKELLKQIDTNNECRRACHKLLKNDFEKIKSESKQGYRGISTHIFRHALFWMNENQKEWDESKLGERYADYIDFTKKCIDRKKLPNYFNTSENLLKGKDAEVLHDLSTALKNRREQLLHIDQ